MLTKKILYSINKENIRHNIKIITIALIIDALWGDPSCLYKKIPHPVIWIGNLINILDQSLNLPTYSPKKQKRHGFYSLFCLILFPGSVAFFLQKYIRRVFPSVMSTVLLSILSSIFLAQRSLYTHVAAIIDPLEKHDIPLARITVGHIVGRKTAHLDPSSIARAAIESLAENFSDGIIAPAFWGCIGGLPGIVIYKAVNTADSMIGHLTKKYQYFGYAAAKTDDYINLPASRLSAIFLILANHKRHISHMTSVIHHARHHNSPNAGWPEAAMAYCLSIKLAGPRQYREKTVHTPWIGDGKNEISAADIKKALKLFVKSCILHIVFLITYLHKERIGKIIN